MGQNAGAAVRADGAAARVWASVVGEGVEVRASAWGRTDGEEVGSAYVVDDSAYAQDGRYRLACVALRDGSVCLCACPDAAVFVLRVEGGRALAGAVAGGASLGGRGGVGAA